MSLLRKIAQKGLVSRYKEMRDEIIISRRKVSEILWAQVFNDYVPNESWIYKNGKLNLCLGRGAIGYPTAYILYRALEENRFDHILELGMGQSSDIIGRYIKSKSEEGVHIAVEHDSEWANICASKYDLSLSIIKVLDLEKIEYPPQKGTYTYKYKDFKKEIGNHKFGLICVDGPYGFNNPIYSRIDILSIIPECLEDTFCIIFDDWDRDGEKNTVLKVEEVLKQSKVEYCKCLFSGEKDTCVIVSKNLGYMRFY